MFKREILLELKKWSERNNRKPLILRRARQAGKTTIPSSSYRERTGEVDLSGLMLISLFL